MDFDKSGAVEVDSLMTVLKTSRRILPVEGGLAADTRKQDMAGGL